MQQGDLLALGVRRDRTRDVLGRWIEPAEGSKLWLRVLNCLKRKRLGTTISPC
ncbi:transposase [Burkholderia pseudomultivorans]|uniref:transposase n=1 Tax=Burkholderia pseudomultivorans TaxID=1207504 RepID=UPI0022AA5EB0|nr:transposase [Burkholderia pseudomultivorans]